MKVPSTRLIIGLGLAIVALLCLSAFLVFYAPLFSTLALIATFAAMYYLAAGLHARDEELDAAPVQPPEAERPASPPGIAVDDLIEEARPAVTQAIRPVAGRLSLPAGEALDRLTECLRGSGWAAVLDEDHAGRPAVSLVPQDAVTPPAYKRRPWLNLLLLGATFVTTAWAGAAHQTGQIVKDPALLVHGLPYAVALLVILGAHELGHYFAARRHGMDVTLPYFVPIPFGLGTFGAFIQLRSPSPTRKSLFDMAVAGPLAGLVAAVPALLIGPPLSTMVRPTATGPAAGAGISVGSSLLLAGLAKLSLGHSLAEAHRVVLNPIAFAGWLGLLLTALNLLPIGQLDGGHIADAMFGRRRSALLGTLSLVILFVFGIFVWSGLLLWAFIIYLIAGRKGLSALDNVTPLDGRRRALGVATFALLIAILLPVPHALYSAIGIHCPYL